jgi:hypothetical protein
LTGPLTVSDTQASPVLPGRYVVVTEESGAGSALAWALHWGALRSVPVQLAGPPGTFVFSRSYLDKLLAQLHRARRLHPGLEVSAAPGATAELRPDDLLVIGVHHEPNDASRARAAHLTGLVPCSVAIVPARFQIQPDGVLAAVSTLDRGRPVARYAAAEAELRGQQLTLLHVREGVDDPLDALVLLLGVEYPHVGVSVARTDGSVIDGIGRAAGQHGLLVIGGDQGAVADSVLAGLVSESVGPIIVARPPILLGPSPLQQAAARFGESRHG